jgi:hypothetical protein
MNANYDPKEGQPEEVKDNAGEQNVLESAAQDNATGATDAEEGTTEG